MKQLLVFPLVLAACAACSSDDGDGTEDPGEMPMQFLGCDKETRAEDYVGGMAKTGEAGIHVELDSDPAPPTPRTDMTWDLLITDADGNPVEGATLTVKPWMPDHNHGTNRVNEVEDMGGGKYEVTRVNFAMDGYWETTITVKTADMTDKVMFKFCAE